MSYPIRIKLNIKVWNVQQELVGVGLAAARIDATARGEAALDHLKHSLDLAEVRDRARQMEGMGLHRLSRFHQTPVGIVPATCEHDPMVDHHR